MSEHLPSKERDIADELLEAVTVLDEPFHREAVAGTIGRAAGTITRLRSDLEELHDAHDELERQLDKANADMAWIRRRTGFWGEVPAAELRADEPPARYQCMVKGCPANHASKRDVCDTRPYEAIAVWLDAEGSFQWDFEINEDHPIDATIALARRTNWVMTDEGWRLAQPPENRP